MDKFWQTMQDVNSKLWKLYLTHIPSHPTTRSLWWLPLHMCPLFLNHQFCRYLQSGLPKIPKIPLLCSRPHYRLPFSPKAQSPRVSRQSRGHRDLIWCPRVGALLPTSGCHTWCSIQGLSSSGTKFICYLWIETSQELRMLSRSLSVY